MYLKSVKWWGSIRRLQCGLPVCTCYTSRGLEEVNIDRAVIDLLLTAGWCYSLGPGMYDECLQGSRSRAVGLKIQIKVCLDWGWGGRLRSEKTPIIKDTFLVVLHNHKKKAFS